MKHLYKSLILLSLLVTTGCGQFISGTEIGGSSPTSENLPSSSTGPNSSTSGDLPTPEGYVYEGTLMKAPFKALNGDGTLIEENSSLARAIQKAGAMGLSTNKTRVEDDNGLKVFERSSLSVRHVYDGTDHYVGTKTQKQVEEWGIIHNRAIVVNGTGTDYTYLGREEMQGVNKTDPNELELGAGAYNYMFSNKGIVAVENTPGYGHAKFNVRFSEASYMPSTDGEGWNAYIFINHRANFNIDLGLIGNLINGEISWRLVRNCSYEKGHPLGDGFKVLGTKSVTTMKYNETTRDYRGADDLEFDQYSTKDGWVLNITNLRTGEVSTINEEHKDMHKDGLVYFRYLLAASYCPVVGRVWNFESGAYLKNVTFDNIKIARYNEEGIYPESSLEDFYPGEKSVSYGYSQGAEMASYINGVHKESGKYASGENYNAGDKYLTFSCYYDGSQPE